MLTGEVNIRGCGGLVAKFASTLSKNLYLPVLNFR